MEQEHIQRAIEYIESNLKYDLNNAILAKITGYSEYHFIRLFRKYVHLTPADYIRKRRISEIVRHIGDEKRPISDIAFEFGFNSKENFTRAFKNEHRILPTEFKTANCSLRLFQPFDFNISGPIPDVSITYSDRLTLIAYPSDEDLPTSFWNKYNAEKRSEQLSGGAVVEDFGAMKWNPEKNCRDYFIGIREELVRGDTNGTVRIDIAEGLYAVFDTPPAAQHDFVSTINRTWDWIYKEWLPGSGYRRGNGFEFESYAEASRKYSERIFVPLIMEENHG
jgi:AraC family transcriptional regulator